MYAPKFFGHILSVEFVGRLIRGPVQTAIQPTLSKMPIAWGQLAVPQVLF